MSFSVSFYASLTPKEDSYRFKASLTLDAASNGNSFMTSKPH